MITIAEYPGGLAGIRRQLEADSQAGGRWAGKRATFERRALIDAGAHAQLIRARVCEVYATLEAREGIVRHVDTTRNVLRYTVDAIAIPYNTAAARKLRGATPEQAKAFRSAYRKADIDGLLEQVGRIAVHSNIAHVLVRWETSGPRAFVLSPHQCDVVWNPDGTEEQPGILTYETSSQGATRVLVDSERWVWVDKDWRVVVEEQHGLGMVPWVRWRWRAPVADYWDMHLGSDLVDCTLDVGRQAAHMRWVRTQRSQKAIVLKLGANDPLPAPQSINGEGGILLQGSAQTGLSTLDPEVSPDNFLRDISESISTAAAAYGLRTASDTGLVDEQAERDRLGKMRARQLGYFARAEHEFAERMAALVSRHAGVLIDDALVDEGFRVRFAPFVPADDPQQQVATAREQQRMGATNPYAFFGQLHPELSEEQAREEVDENVTLISEFTSDLVTRGLAISDGNQLQTLSQVQGRLGGQASGEARHTTQEDSITP